MPHFSYDEVPYPDYCYEETHPSRMEMLGKLLGMTPTSVEHCHVLEIGCAGGGNILPMAAVLPNSTFVGIDNSIVQIESAQADLQASELTNLTFRHMDIMDITPEFGQFDYIIAHGIYSWVPPAVRDKLLDVCKHNLTPQGIVYVSYNTYPGWHSLEIIRDIMLYRTRDSQSPIEKSAQAREWISFMAHALSDHSDSAYAALFENYLAFRVTQTTELDHQALLHDELSDFNTPVYFHQFATHVEQHGLQYLTESDFPTVMPNGLTDDVVQHLSETARTTVEMEQYMDYLRNRTFRRTLLCHAEVEVNRQLRIDPIRQFYVTSAASSQTVDADITGRGIERFIGSNQIAFATDHPLTKAAFHYLIASAPQRVHFDVLVRQSELSLGISEPSGNDRVALAANLLRAFASSFELVEFHSFAPPLVTTISDRPVTTPLLRLQARQGHVLANLLHQRTNLEHLNRVILMNLTGENDHVILLDFLVNLVQKGTISLEEGSPISQTEDEVRAMMSNQLDTALQILAHRALLVG